MMVYSDFLIKENVFFQGQFSSQYNKRSTWTSLTFLTIFEQNDVSNITVRRMKKKSHSKIFDIRMRPLREDQKHRYHFTC